jgi:hypothetical protein
MSARAEIYWTHSSKQVGAVRQGNFVIALSVGLMWLSASGAGPSLSAICVRSTLGCCLTASCPAPYRYGGQVRVSRAPTEGPPQVHPQLSSNKAGGVMLHCMSQQLAWTRQELRQLPSFRGPHFATRRIGLKHRLVEAADTWRDWPAVCVYFK